MNIKQTKNSISLSQSHYIDLSLSQFHLDHLHPSKNPLNPKVKLSPATDTEINEFQLLQVNYCSLIGALNFISTNTRPNITYAVSSLSQFLKKPGIKHYKAAVKVFRYLKGTKNFFLTFSPSDNLNNPLTVHTDADWENCPYTRRSYSGFLCQFLGCPVSWQSQKQPTVSLSTTEAE